jgi:hypothetical protein
MKHYLFNVVSELPAPAAGNDMGSWFLFYKWDVDDEVFVPVHEPTRSRFLDAEPGDFLWFSLDSKVIGCVSILRLVDEQAQRKVEVWYDASAKVVVDAFCSDVHRTGKLPKEVGEQWAGILQKIP